MVHTPSWKTLPVPGVSIWSKGLSQTHSNQASPPTRGRTERGHLLRPETDGWDPGAPSPLWAGNLLLRGGAPRVRWTRRRWPAAGLPRPDPRRFSAAASGCLCFATSREPRRRRREEGSGRRRRPPRQEAPGHRRLRRPPSPPSPSRAFSSLPPPSLALLPSPRLPSALPRPPLRASPPPPRALRCCSCGRLQLPQMWAGRRAGNFRAGCECGAPAVVRLPWIRRREPPAACSAPRCCCSCCCRCPRTPGSPPLPPTPQVGAAESPRLATPVGRVPPRAPHRPLPRRRPARLGQTPRAPPGAKLANFGAGLVGQGAPCGAPGNLGPGGAPERSRLSGRRAWRQRAGKAQRRRAQHQHQRVRGSQGEAAPRLASGDAREQSGAERAALGLEDWLGRPGGDPRRSEGPCSTPPCSRARGGGGRQRANLELYAEDRPPVPGGAESSQLRRRAVRAVARRGLLRGRSARVGNQPGMASEQPPCPAKDGRFKGRGTA